MVNCFPKETCSRFKSPVFVLDLHSTKNVQKRSTSHVTMGHDLSVEIQVNLDGKEKINHS